MYLAEGEDWDNGFHPLGNLGVVSHVDHHFHVREAVDDPQNEVLNSTASVEKWHVAKGGRLLQSLAGFYLHRGRRDGEPKPYHDANWELPTAASKSHCSMNTNEATHPITSGLI